jgi:hypothetical protein
MHFPGASPAPSAHTPSLIMHFPGVPTPSADHALPGRVAADPHAPTPSLIMHFPGAQSSPAHAPPALPPTP